MAATLTARSTWSPNVDPTMAELAQVLNALFRITNIAIMSAVGTASLAGSTSATYVDVGSTSTSWTKDGGSSDSDVLCVLLVSGCYVSVAATAPTFGVKIGSTDYDIVSMNINQINTHTPLVGARAITGVAAGAYTPIVRFKRAGGTGTVTIDTGDTVSFIIGELPK